MIRKPSLPFLGFLQATGLFVYIILITLLISNLGKMGIVDDVFSPLAFLLLFVISAVISGSLVLARTGFLFWERRYKEAFSLLIWTTISAIFYLVSVFVFLIASK